MKTIAICGLGGAGKEILELVERVNQWDSIVFCDKSVYEANRSFRGYDVYTFEELAERFAKDEIEFIISVGDVFLREKIAKQIKVAGYTLARLVAPNVNIPKTATLGDGVIVRDNCYISVDVTLEENVMIQSNTVIGHDVVVGYNSIISSGTIVSGGATIGNNTYIAVGCTIKELTNVGNSVIASMGTAINKNIDDNLIVKGNPVEIVSKNYLRSAFLLNRFKNNE